MRKFTVEILVITIIIFTLFPIINFADDEDEELDFSWAEENIETDLKEPNIQSKFAVAYDRNSKAVLWGKNETIKTPMASTTKIMTAIIFLEWLDSTKNNFNTEITVCKEAASIGGSRLGLKVNDKIRYNDLLYGLMLKSGNDAAIQIAVSVGGSIDNFAELMNKKAKELNLTNTHFKTPHGLDNDEHYTTAYELAIIADYALNIEKFAEIVNTKSYEVTINGYKKMINNTNELLGYLDGVNGVKTGFTNNAGRCLVTSVNRNGFNIITVVLGADTKNIRTKDSIKIINYIYNNYEEINLEKDIQEKYKEWKKFSEDKIYIEKGKKHQIDTYIEEQKLKKYPVLRSEKENIKIEIDSINYVEAPVKINEIVGILRVYVNGKRIENIKIKTKYSIEKKDIIWYLKECMGVIFKANILTDAKIKLN